MTGFALCLTLLAAFALGIVVGAILTLLKIGTLD
jgi:hypothetical protein